VYLANLCCPSNLIIGPKYLLPIVNCNFTYNCPFACILFNVKKCFSEKNLSGINTYQSGNIIENVDIGDGKRVSKINVR